jgi:hypothetical protein
MATVTKKHSKEALAFLTLYKAMTPEVKVEVRDILIKTSVDTSYEITTEMMTDLSEDAFGEIWDKPENVHWDDFIKERLQCTNKEI